jgi:hypothetical protein
MKDVDKPNNVVFHKKKSQLVRKKTLQSPLGVEC